MLNPLVPHLSTHENSPQEGLDAHGAPPLRTRATADAAGGTQNVYGQDDVRDQQFRTRLRPTLLRV